MALEFSYAGLAGAESHGATDEDHIPEEVFRLLAGDSKREREKIADKEEEGVEVAPVSDDALMQELEGALKALQQ